jgi:type VI secretion system protein ImpG
LAAVNRQLVDGVLALSSRRTVARIDCAAGSGFCRGMEVTLELDEQKYLGIGAFLFASVLQRCLGLYASINSFTQLVVKTRQGEGILKAWPPRAGELQLI